MSGPVLVSDEDVAELQDLYERALKQKDEEAIHALAGEAMQAAAYRTIVEECREALSLGVEEASDVISTMVPVAEAMTPASLGQTK